MHQTQRERTRDLLRTHNIEQALFADRPTVTWLTGFAPPLQVGTPHQFAGGPLLVWYEGGHFHLIVVDAHEDDAAPFNDEADGTLITYEGYTIEKPMTPAENLAAELARLLRSASPRKTGVQANTLPVFLHEVLANALSVDAELVPIDDWLAPLRRIKTDEELAKLRANFALTDAGHRAAREAIQPGMREIDIWAVIQGAINGAAGQRVPLGNDCVVGYRDPNNIGGWPLDYPIRAGDALTVDLGTALHGYWSDSCCTYYAGEPNEKQVAMHKVAADALEYAISLIKPGAVARDIDREVRAFIERAGYPVYPHHTGHGAGVRPHEAPRIVPYNDEILEPGMVLLLEPGIYFPGETGVRLEDAVLVTADGAEVLTMHDKGL